MQCLQKDPEKCKFKYSRKLSSVETNQNIKQIFLKKKKKKKKVSTRDNVKDIFCGYIGCMTLQFT